METSSLVRKRHKIMKYVLNVFKLYVSHKEFFYIIICVFANNDIFLQKQATSSVCMTQYTNRKTSVMVLYCSVGYISQQGNALRHTPPPENTDYQGYTTQFCILLPYTDF